MITLHTFGPFLGAPDASPFVIKAMLLLKLAGLPYVEKRGNPFSAPRGLLPYIEDEDERVTDSTLIRFHLERKYRHDFDAALDTEQKAAAWCVEKMCEEHLYFALLHMRWCDRATFDQGLGRYMFGVIPAPARPLAKALLRRMNAKRLSAQGMGRHAPAEIAALAARDVEALAVLLGGKPWLMGDAPCAADAAVFGLLAAILTPPLQTPLRTAAEQHPALLAYRDRLMSRYFADAATCQDSDCMLRMARSIATDSLDKAGRSRQ